jgi:hypothetical protein
MCNQSKACQTFDPDLCPLLQGLSPEEKRRRMDEDPVIRNCVALVDGVEVASRETAKLAAAYEKRRLKRKSGEEKSF